MVNTENACTNIRSEWPQNKIAALVIGNIIGAAVAAYGFFYVASFINSSVLLQHAGIGQFSDLIAWITIASGIWYCIIVSFFIIRAKPPVSQPRTLRG